MVTLAFTIFLCQAGEVPLPFVERTGTWQITTKQNETFYGTIENETRTVILLKTDDPFKKPRHERIEKSDITEQRRETARERLERFKNALRRAGWELVDTVDDRKIAVPVREEDLVARSRREAAQAAGRHRPHDGPPDLLASPLPPGYEDETAARDAAAGQGGPPSWVFQVGIGVVGAVVIAVIAKVFLFR